MTCSMLFCAFFLLLLVRRHEQDDTVARDHPGRERVHRGELHLGELPDEL